MVLLYLLYCLSLFCFLFYIHSSTHSFIFIEVLFLSLWCFQSTEMSMCPLQCHHQPPEVKGQCKKGVLDIQPFGCSSSSSGNPNRMKSLGRLCELHAWINGENDPITTTTSCFTEKAGLLQSEPGVYEDHGSQTVLLETVIL